MHEGAQPEKVVITVNNAEPGTRCEWCDCTDTRMIGDYPCLGACDREADFEICDTAIDYTFMVCEYHQADCLRFIRKTRTGGFAEAARRLKALRGNTIQ